MNTPTIRALSRRAGATLAHHNAAASQPVFSYGRTAAYRRIDSHLRTYSDVALRQRQDPPSQLPPFALRSHFLPSSLSHSGPASVRYVSFKEMREERARQNAGKAPSKPEKKEAKAKAAEPEPEVKTEEASGPSAAEQAFASAKAESDAQWAKFEEQARREEEEAAKKGEQAEEGEQQQQKKQKKDEPVEPPHGSKTPWQVFTETLSTEFKNSKEWNEGTKELSGSIHDFTQNPNVQKAKSAYTKAADVAGSTTSKVVLGSASAIGKGAAWTFNTLPARAVRKTATVVGSGIEKATRPIRETEAYKSVKDTVDDGASQRYGGWTDKDERRRQRELREAREGRRPASLEAHDEDPNAGTNVTLHKDSAWNQSWKDFRDNSPIMQRVFGMGAVYRESENPLISTARSVSDRIAGFFAENETAMVIKKFREMDGTFRLEPFLQEMRTYILPEVLEAYVKGDVETLKLWLSAAQFQVYSALMHQYTQHGLQSDGRILDIRGVDILSARILDPGEVPVFVLMARTQEVHVYKNKKTGQLAAGMEDKVQQVTYAIGITRIPEEVANPETRGWRLIELQKSARDYI